MVAYAIVLGVGFVVFLSGCTAAEHNTPPKAPPDFSWGERNATPGVRLRLREVSRDRGDKSTRVN